MSDVFPYGYAEESEEMVGSNTATPPANAPGSEDPGLVFRYGPNFVRFVVDRFAFVEHALSKMLQRAEITREREGQRFFSAGNTDSSGNVEIELFRAQPGQKFNLHRCYVAASGFTIAAPSTACGLQVNIDGSPWSAFYGPLPAVFSAGRLHAPEAQDGERLTVQILGGPASTRISLHSLGVLGTVYGDDGGA